MRATSRSAPAGQAGFTLMEVLIVVMIIGLLVATVAIPINSYLQRSRIEGAANDVRSFLVGAQSLALGTSSQVTVSVRQTGGEWSVELAPAREPSPGSPLALIPRRLALPRFVRVNGLTLGAGIDWPVNAGVHQLVCDTIGRTIDPVSAGQIQGTRVLRLTHELMVSGTVTPAWVFELRVNPLWNVIIEKRRG